MPTLALALGLLACVLAVAGIALATVANRRHMATRKAADGTRGDARSELYARVDLLDDAVAELADAVSRLEGSLADAPTGHGDDPETTGRVTQLEVDLTDLRERHDTEAERASATRSDLDSATTRLEVLAEVSAEAVDSSRRVARDLQSTIERVADHGQLVGARLQSLTSQLDALRDHVLSADPTALRHVAVVRYDAFAGVGGRLSYSLAVLDDTDTGFVITTLSGKSEVRTYVRAVGEGTSDGTLTVEECQAIEAARQGAGIRT